MHPRLQPDRRRNSVLIVDDSDDAAWALAVLLQTCGHDVHVAHSGGRALDMAERLRPAVIFLDLAMPGMDGFEMAMRIRRRRWGGGIVLCALTAFDTPEYRERSDEVGIDRYLPKPAEWADLVAVATAAERRESREAPAARCGTGAMPRSLK
jgi:DNA-binding response OmpR family regulator